MSKQYRCFDRSCHEKTTIEWKLCHKCLHRIVLMTKGATRYNKPPEQENKA